MSNRLSVATHSSRSRSRNASLTSRISSSMCSRRSSSRAKQDRRSASATSRWTTTSSSTGRTARCSCRRRPARRRSTARRSTIPGVTPTHGTDALPPQTLNDVPIVPGRTVVGISANRGTQDDAVTFISQGGADAVRDPDLGLQRRLEQRAVHGSRRGAAAARAGDLRAALRGSAAAPRRRPSSRSRPRRTSTPSSSSTASSSRASTATRPPTRRVDHARSRTKLNTFKNAGFPSSILQVDAGRDARFSAAYDALERLPVDPARANAVVAAVDARVRAFKAAKPTVQYVVLVGSDDVIPFARLDDRTTLSNEDAFAGSFDPSSPIGGALAASKMLSDDPYGTLAPVPFFDRQLYVPGARRRPPRRDAGPDPGAGRRAFTTGQIAGGTALTTGYDFLTRRRAAGQRRTRPRGAPRTTR